MVTSDKFLDDTLIPFPTSPSHRLCALWSLQNGPKLDVVSAAQIASSEARFDS